MAGLIEVAKQIAREAHKGQIRKYNGEDYINHPRRVASKFSTEDSQVIAWLHDVLEDTDWKARDLLSKGIGYSLIEIVKVLTRQEGETYFHFIMRIKDIIQARIIKIEDIRDNLIDLREGNLKDKYRLALHILEEENTTYNLKTTEDKNNG